MSPLLDSFSSTHCLWKQVMQGVEMVDKGQLTRALRVHDMLVC